MESNQNKRPRKQNILLVFHAKLHKSRAKMSGNANSTVGSITAALVTPQIEKEIFVCEAMNPDLCAQSDSKPILNPDSNV